MTPFEELGYTAEDLFRVKQDGVDNCGFLTDEDIILHDDDGSAMPKFRRAYGEGDWYYVKLCNIERVDEDK